MKRLKWDQQKQESLCIFLYFIVAAVTVLLLATRSSFLYPCNNWDDANSYFSVGKAIFNGKLPYREVFDQKGILLYFLYGLCYLISHTTFAGVFVMECILAFFDLVGIYRILLLYMGRNTALVLTPYHLPWCSLLIAFTGAAQRKKSVFRFWSGDYTLDSVILRRNIRTRRWTAGHWWLQVSWQVWLQILNLPYWDFSLPG